jgi:hypothetical protein
MKTSKKSKQEKINKTTIEKTDTRMWLGKNSIQVSYEGSLYLTNIAFVEEKIKSLPAHIRLGVMTEDGINNDVDAWITVKGKAVYFTPKKDVVLISSLSGLKELLSGERDNLDFGIFK